MLPVSSAEHVYSAIDELVRELRSVGPADLATVLDHRVHKVAWTARDELFEELEKVLASRASDVPAHLRGQVERIREVIRKALIEDN